MACQGSTYLLHGKVFFIDKKNEILVAYGYGYICLFLYRMMSTESANSFTLIGEASDGGTMENLSRRLKVIGSLTS